eukprot:2846563-Rhodomonas_salina.1
MARNEEKAMSMLNRWLRVQVRGCELLGRRALRRETLPRITASGTPVQGLWVVGSAWRRGLGCFMFWVHLVQSGLGTERESCEVVVAPAPDPKLTLEKRRGRSESVASPGVACKCIRLL